VELSATLQYRKFDTTYLRYIQGDAFSGNDLPVTAMATDRVVLPVAADDAVAAQRVATDPVERWNDYGIGLLREGNGGAGRGELRQAEQAFRQVEALGHGTGALNLARVYFREGRLDEAAAALQRAGNGNPAAPPWSIAWYSALIDRENGHLDAAIDTLESLVETRFQDARARGFDFSQDIRILNELGRAEFERSRQLRGKARAAQRQAALARARDWFLQVLVIEPEDLTAHHNLALVYSALGEKRLAAVQRELHEKYRPDDQAIEQAVTRHRSSHPAADHAAAAIVIHDLDREASADAAVPADMHDGRQPPGITRLTETVPPG
jgi:tetratricopeptide (TPR) repeat protein